VRSTIKLLGHAGLDIRRGAARVVCDPWLSPRGAYLGGWHQFPSNAHLEAGDLHDTPTVFISSPSPDRFDAETLAAFPKNARVVLPKLVSPVLADRVRALGFSEVVELPDWEPLDLGDGVRLQVVASSSKHLLSATLVVDLGGPIVVAQNDCQLDDAALDRLAALHPQLHFLAFSGSSYLPALYDLPPERMQELVAAEKRALLERFFATAARVGATAVIPSAGPPCFIDERSFALSAGESIYFDSDELAAEAARQRPDLASRLRLLYPGDVAVGEDGAWQLDGRRPYDDKRAHLEEIRRQRAPLRAAHLDELRSQATPVDGKELRSYLRDFFQYEDMTWDLGILIEIRVTGGPSTWIDFRKKPFRYLAECGEPANFVLTVDSAWVSLVLQGKLTWREILMGHQATIHRDPDRDSVHLMNHLDHRHDPVVFDVVRWLDPAMITIQDEQNEYVCQRFCPHRGRDLEYAIIERGVLTCTAHGWRFDLRRGGKCLWGGTQPLVVKEIRPLKG
jgi:UDP-MurNAc hydroxylase